VSDVDQPQPFGPFVGRIDDAFDRALDKVRGNVVADRMFYGLSQAFNFSAGWHLINLVRLAASPRRKREALRLAICLGIESLLVNQGVKRLFRRGRPSFDGDHPHSLRQPSTSSFPSGHATSAFLAATLLGSGASRRVRWTWSALAALVSLSRPYVRVHHASDIVGGALIGRLLGRLARRLWPL
jgi:undecaprenyl-diphosphatase